MDLPGTKAATITTVTLTCLLFLYISFYTIAARRGGDASVFTYGQIVMVLSLALAAAVSLLILVTVARATMVAWITVLVLLAFSGKRRRVLARQGRRIAADVAVYLVKIVVRERGLLAVACAAAVSFMAVVGECVFNDIKSTG